jgi:Zn-dependent protease with chaperone function
VSHAIARHGGERISQQLAVQGGLLATQAALAGRMAAQGGPRQPEFLSTHPVPQTRITQIEAWLPR